jgi:hypothetical protein
MAWNQTDQDMDHWWYLMNTVINMSMLFFWDVMTCGLVGRYQRFGETVSIIRVEVISPEDGDSMFL